MVSSCDTYFDATRPVQTQSLTGGVFQLLTTSNHEETECWAPASACQVSCSYAHMVSALPPE
eukprot:320097-Amphidinium_carterae.1